jgi:putative membrane-bound dehydrogenase-like protein
LQPHTNNPANKPHSAIQIDLAIEPSSAKWLATSPALLLFRLKRPRNRQLQYNGFPGPVKRRVIPHNHSVLRMHCHWHPRLVWSAIVLALANPLFAQPTSSPATTLEVVRDGDTLQVRRSGASEPILTQVAQPEMRPYVHPLMAPDGKGLLTQFQPDHHKHQTGIYWGLTRVNGRDYFHHPADGYWRLVSCNILKPSAATPGDTVQWQTVYDMLDASGKASMQESMIWTMRDFGDRYELDLQWSGKAIEDVTIGQYDYGGLFVRMPWRDGLPASVINNARQRDARAEGQRAVWLDVGVQVEGRDDMAHIAILDHPQNSGFPQPWRVDGQFGVGPVRARMGDWSIPAGATETVRHRLVVYTGEMSDVKVSQWWSDFSGQDMAYAQWIIARQDARQAAFLNPQQAVDAMTLQDGFAANVFAAEPTIGQPMAMCFDAKGRIWVAENRDYETRQKGYANDGNSRILILEDTNRDGTADTSKVFLEGIPFPAAMAVGMDGLWLGAPPNLLFVPDRNRDDRADMDDIEVRLTGWGIDDRHETLNSFIWGPDGWLYGLQGFATPSRVGKPQGKGTLFKLGDPFPKTFQYSDQPIDFNGGVWRYHPTKDRFEVVAHGFSNPWGIDYDANGQLFITACVIPHLWHIIPGGIYHRQGGSHFNPYYYSDIRTIADHGHQSAHGGARIYQSDAFPETYRGRIFMANIHEHAVLTDILEPSGSGFIGRHGDDFMLANNAQWVGFSIDIGPDGSVYVLDWHDADICGNEITHKDTGRIFRLSAKQSTAASFPHRNDDLQQLDDLSLANLQTAPSAWHANQARTILQHRATQRSIDPEAIDKLRSLWGSTIPSDQRMRSLWARHVIGNLDEATLVAILDDAYPYARGWAIQLLCEDGPPSSATLEKMASMAATDPSPVVRNYLASAAQRLPSTQRWPILEALAMHADDIDDHNLPKMIWFALEPLVVEDLTRSIDIARRSAIPVLTRHIARRLTDGEMIEEAIAAAADASSSDEACTSMLLGIRDAIEGRYDLKPPQGWNDTFTTLQQRPSEISKIALDLSQQFGDVLAAEQMIQTLRDPSADLEARRQALQSLAGRQRQELIDQLIGLLDEPALRRDAIRAMSAFDEGFFADELLKRYGSLSSDEKLEAVHTLAARANYGRDLTDAIASGAIPKSDVPAYVARLLRRVVGPRFVDVWGPIDQLDADKQGLFEKYQQLLAPTAVASADLVRGRTLFQKTCAACHQLHADGGQVGPDITGANRSNLEYLLSNILTPSATIQDAYRMHVIVTDDGRIYSGIPVEENDRQIRLRVADREQPVTIASSQIESREIAAVSMMPDGLLTTLADQDVIDLIAYLQTQKQVPLPPSTESPSPK